MRVSGNDTHACQFMAQRSRTDMGGRLYYIQQLLPSPCIKLCRSPSIILLLQPPLPSPLHLHLLILGVFEQIKTVLGRMSGTVECFSRIIFLCLLLAESHKHKDCLQLPPEWHHVEVKGTLWDSAILSKTKCHQQCESTRKRVVTGYIPCYLCEDVVRDGSMRFDVLEPHQTSPLHSFYPL